MDVQIKIKILKYIVDELQKPFYKNKEERFIKTFGSWVAKKQWIKHH